MKKVRAGLVAVATVALVAGGMGGASAAMADGGAPVVTNAPCCKGIG